MKKHKTAAAAICGGILIWLGVAQLVTFPVCLIATGSLLIFISICVAIEKASDK